MTYSVLTTIHTHTHTHKINPHFRVVLQNYVFLNTYFVLKFYGSMFICANIIARTYVLYKKLKINVFRWQKSVGASFEHLYMPFWNVTVSCFLIENLLENIFLTQEMNRPEILNAHTNKSPVHLGQVSAKVMNSSSSFYPTSRIRTIQELASEKAEIRRTSTIYNARSLSSHQ